MVEIVSVAGLCITAVLLCKIIEKYNKEQAVILSIAGITIIMTVIFSVVSPVIYEINRLFELSGTESENIEIIFKSLGISYITQLTSDICKDCGESTIASGAETAGKILILLISLPLFSEITGIVISLI